MLEVKIVELHTRVPYGINTTSATSGVFGADYPGTHKGDAGPDIPAGTVHLIRTAMVEGREVASFFLGLDSRAADAIHGHHGRCSSRRGRGTARRDRAKYS